MTLGDLYLRMYNSQTIIIYEKGNILIARTTIGTIPNDLLNRKVDWITLDNSSNLEIYLS